MFHILGFIFFIVLIVLLIGLFILLRILRFFGIGKNQKRKYYYKDENQSAGFGQTSETIVDGVRKKKVFDRNDGEYIDFEDV